MSHHMSQNKDINSQLKNDKTIPISISKTPKSKKRSIRKLKRLIKNGKDPSKTCKRLASMRHIKVVTNHMIRIAKLTSFTNRSIS
jgi:hypothetical protein